MDSKADKKITAEKKSENEAIRKRDQILIKAAIQGSSKAFATLISYYQTRVYRFGLSFFKNNADADDFVQDVFIKVYTNLTSFRGDSLFSTWLMRIAYTTALNNVTRKKEYLSLAEDFDIPSIELTPEEAELQKLTKQAVNEAVKSLPEKYAIVIDMYFFYDIPYLQISDITKLPVNTIKSHIFRAKKILKEKLEM